MKRNYHYHQFLIIKGSHIVKAILAIVVLLLCVFSLSGLLTSVKPEYRPASKSVNDATSVFSGKILFSLLTFENHYFTASLEGEEKGDSLEEKLLKLSANISLDDPRSLLGSELPGFAQFDSEIMVAGEGTDYTNMPYESAPPDDHMAAKKDAALQNVADLNENDQDAKAPASGSLTAGKKVAFIYHSHNYESYLPYLKGVTDPDKASHSQINVARVGKQLQNSLEAQGIGAVADNTDIMKRLVSKGWKYPKSYQESRQVVQTAMANNKDLAYIIDIHRDSRRKKDTTAAINGRAYARLAFIVGGDNAQYQKNYALADKLHRALQKKYPGLSRGVFKQGGKGKNGIYNQDLSDQAMLIEAGGVDNNFEELKASMDAFADVFSEYYMSLNEAEKVNAAPAK
ncbi:MAG: stage II sporulation protein P [Bacillus sp. (in: firmicutes)]